MVESVDADPVDMKGWLYLTIRSTISWCISRKENIPRWWKGQSRPPKGSTPSGRVNKKWTHFAEREATARKTECLNLGTRWRKETTSRENVNHGMALAQVCGLKSHHRCGLRNGTQKCKWVSGCAGGNKHISSSQRWENMHWYEMGKYGN